MENSYKQGGFLDHLTKALYDAVVQAQSLAENQHIESLKKFFDKDGNPKSMEIKIPDEKGKQEKPEGLMKVMDMLNSSIGKGKSSSSGGDDGK